MISILFSQGLTWLKLEALHWISMRLPNLAMAAAYLYAGHVLIFFLLTLLGAVLTAYWAPYWAIPLVLIGLWVLYFGILYRFQRSLVLKPMVQFFLSSISETLEDHTLPKTLDGLEVKRDSAKWSAISAAMTYTAEKAFEPRQ